MDIHNFQEPFGLWHFPQLDPQVIVRWFCCTACHIGLRIIPAVPYPPYVKGNGHGHPLVKFRRNLNRVPYLVIGMPFTDLCAVTAPGIGQHGNGLFFQFCIVLHYFDHAHRHGAVTGADLHIANFLRDQVIRQKPLDVLIRKHRLPARNVSRRDPLLFPVAHGKLQVRFRAVFCAVFYNKVNPFF